MKIDPGVDLPLIATGLLYGVGRKSARGTKTWQTACFWLGWVALAAALASPLDELGEDLFSAHMIQHEILMLVAAPLLVLSRPLVPMLWGLPLEWRRGMGRWTRTRLFDRIWRAVTTPAAAWTIHAAALWLWHVPALFEATLASEWVHAAQHLSFLGSALLFWWSLFHGRGAGNHGPAVLYLFTTAVHTSILGALLTFSHSVWYPVYVATSLARGISPLEDQQLGGLIMWVPGGVIYLAAALAMLAAWLRESEAMVQRRRYAA